MRSFFNFVFPCRCVSCGSFGSYICQRCAQKIEIFDPQHCIVCEKPSLLGITHAACREKTPVHATISLARYSGPALKMIRGIKYGLYFDMSMKLCDLLSPRMKYLFTSLQINPDEYVIEPIPLHPARLRARGFNQSEVFAKYISQMFSIPLSRTLYREKNTHTQSEIAHRIERDKNLHDAFICHSVSKITKNILLIDDVLTTGSTCKEAAKSISKYCNNRIIIMTIAHG